MNLAEDLLLKQVPMVFLKQMRACNDTDRAVYQAIVEAPCRITHFDTGGLIDGSEVQLHSYASQPLHTDLGVAEGWVKPLLATWIRCNFDLEVASGIWDYAQRQ